MDNSFGCYSLKGTSVNWNMSIKGKWDYILEI